MWNTGCRNVYNHLQFDLLIVDNEDTSRQLTVPGVGADGTVHHADYGGTIFPWCWNSGEVGRKAFRVYDRRGFGGDGHHKKFRESHPVLLYMFQDYGANEVYWIRPNDDGRYGWTDRQYGGEGPSSFVSLTITGTGPKDIAVHAITTG